MRTVGPAPTQRGGFAARTAMAPSQRPPDATGPFSVRDSRTGQGYDAGMVSRVLLAFPRGYCAGVERAVETVELALEHYGPPVYVRKQIVHNIHVVRDLEARGAIFVESEAEAPPGATIVYSAHGVAPSVHAASAERSHNVIDATCPLVTKVHVQARRYAADGYTVVLIGHAGHEEVVGTMGEAPESTVLVQDVAEAEALGCRPTRRSPTSRRRRSRSTRRRRSSAPCAGGSRRSTRRRRRTSVTRPPTASGR